MPVILGEVRVLTKPLSGVRILQLLFDCLAFSLAASLEPRSSFKNFCMFSWCFFFTLTFLILLVDFVQFQSIIPLSWKNLPITVASLGALMCIGSSAGFPLFMQEDRMEPKAIGTTVCSCLAFMAYVSEVHLIRLQSREQRGYMASIPGLLKVFQVFSGCAMIFLFSSQCQMPNFAKETSWLFWFSAANKLLCFLMSLGTTLVVLGDCVSHCPLPFDRLLVSFCSLAVLLYIVVAVECITKILVMPAESVELCDPTRALPFIEMITACLTLLAYMVDLAFSVKLLCDRA